MAELFDFEFLEKKIKEHKPPLAKLDKNPLKQPCMSNLKGSFVL